MAAVTRGAEGPVILGFCEPGYCGVYDAFLANFKQSLEVGAAVAIYADGRPVVDLWGGLADARTGRPWIESTPVVVFSVTKGLVAMLALAPRRATRTLRPAHTRRQCWRSRG